MLTKEDVESWNKLFPDCQISESNLSHPTEQFLTLALVCYLKRFGYNVEPPFSLNAENKENSKENRLFSIKLARQIDHFLKITDKSYAFTYYDLIRPTPKKTSHMLYILLNYYYYYNLYKEKVFQEVGNRIRTLENLKALIDDTRRDNELRQEEVSNMKSTIDNLMEELPVARMTLKELLKTKALKDEEFLKLQHKHQELEEKREHLERQRKDLRKRVVSDKESEDLQKQVQNLKLQLAERKEMEQKNKENIKESQYSKAKLEHLSKEIKKAREIIPLRLIEQLNETNKQLEKAQKEDTEEESKHEIMTQQIEEETRALKSLEHQQKNKKQEFGTKQEAQLKALAVKQNALEQKNTQISELEEEDHILECQLEEQKDIAEYLKENINEIMAAYEN